MASLPLENRRTDNSEWYLITCLLEMKSEKPTIDVGSRTQLTSQNIELTSHPHDLASNDLCLFPIVRNKLGGHRLSTPEEAVEQCFGDSQSEW